MLDGKSHNVLDHISDIYDHIDDNSDNVLCFSC